MRMVMEVRRCAGQYQGSLTRMSDQHCVPFIGVLELVAAIERLEPDEHERARTEPVQPPPRS